MPVRHIPRNYRNVTGKAASDKTKSAYFESTLERDFLTSLEFDKTVRAFEVQPIEINWFDENGKVRTYTPDVLVDYYTYGEDVLGTKRVLYEVKYRKDIAKNWTELKPKFRAAIRYANFRGWRFKLITEKELKTHYVENAKFLLPYLQAPRHEQHEQQIMDMLDELQETNITQLLNALADDAWEKAELIPAMWYLIADQHIGSDLFRPLTMSSRIWSPR